MISPMAAAKAYSAMQDTAGVGGGGKAASIGGADFGQMVQNAINDTISTSQHAEQQMQAHTQGKAALIDVATSISSAQASLETVMAVRDQVISAYQEIMRMTI
jgi:flagellar hook-basal body complex protein FliE